MTPSQVAREIAERIWKLWDSGRLSSEAIAAEVEPLVRERDEALNAERVVLKQAADRISALEALARDLREALRRDHRKRNLGDHEPCATCALLARADEEVGK